MARTPPAGPRRWKLGLFYVDPTDRRVLVPRRLGQGLTLNLGRPGAWLALLLILGVQVALAFLLTRAL